MGTLGCWWVHNFVGGSFGSVTVFLGMMVGHFWCCWALGGVSRSYRMLVGSLVC